MAIVKNFGLGGIASDVQLGKGGARIIADDTSFSFKQTNGTSNAGVTANGFTSIAGQLLLNDTTLDRLSAGVLEVSGTGGFVVPVGSTAQRPPSVTGTIRTNNDIPAASTVEYYNGTSWITLSTGGSIAALQAEVDAIEVSLGAAIDSNGVFVPGGFTGTVIVSPTSFTDAIQQVADYAVGHDTLDEIFPSTADGNLIYSAGGVWEQAAPGVTTGVQPYSAKLTSVASNATNGIIVQTDGTTVTARSLVQPAAGITITNADGVAGNPTFALANDLAALEGLTTSGYIVRTGDGTATTRSISGTAGNIVVTNGDGVTSDTSLDLGTVSQATTGDFVKVTLDTFGRVTGNTPVTSADIIGVAGGAFLQTNGSNQMSADLNVANNKVVNLAEPTDPTDAATKNYVDNAITGLSWKQAAQALSPTNVALTGGATLTIDGVVIGNGDRILLTGQTNAYENGIYVASGIGTTYALARTSDADTFQELNGAAIFIQDGTLYANSGWTQTAQLTSLTTGATQSWQQFSGAGSYTGGTGIDITGNIISAKLGAGIASVPTGEIGLDLYNASTGALILTNDGSTRGTASGDALFLLLNGAGGLGQDASGLKINDAGVTNAMLVNSSIGLNADTGTSTVDLGQTLEVAGDSVQGIATAVTGQTITVSGIDASTSQKGVASFATGTFAVTAGAVDVKAGGITNTQLVNSTITINADSGTPDPVSLGETLLIAGTSAQGITTAVTGNTVTVTAADATTTTKGVASFNTASFTVTAGAVSLSTVDVAHGGTGATSFTAGELLYGNGTSALAHSSTLKYVTDTLTIGDLSINGNTQTIAGAQTDTDIIIAPDGLGQVIIGAAGPGYISSELGQDLTVLGDTGLTLGTNSGSIDIGTGADLIASFSAGSGATNHLTVVTDGTNNVQLGASGGNLQFSLSGTTNSLHIIGPSAAQYAAAVVAGDANTIPNKQYVTDAVAAAGSASGTVKAYKATVSLAATGTTNIGAALPANATVLRVKINVTSAAGALTVLTVGTGATDDRYADATSNDPASVGLYIVETLDADAASVQVIATVSGTAVSGSAVVLVEYLLA